MTRTNIDSERTRARETTPDGRARMIGPFFAPLTHDWLFGLWLGLTMAWLWSVPSRPGGDQWTVANTIPWLVLGMIGSAFSTLAFLGVTVGAWRGYRLGQLEGRRSQA